MTSTESSIIIKRGTTLSDIPNKKPFGWSEKSTIRNSVSDVLTRIEDIQFKMTDPRMDGFTTFAEYERLLCIKEKVDKALANAPSYSVKSVFEND
jgi:hypothetical protein